MRSKAKGNANERVLAKLFTNWTGWEFHRTPSSGGLHWKEDFRTCGDLVCELEHADEFPFSVETKRRKVKVSSKRRLVRNVIDLSKLLISGYNSNILKFWGQAIADANRSGKEPIMFLRNTGMPKDMYFVFLDFAGIGVHLDDFSINCMHNISLGLTITTSSELFSIDCMDIFKKVVKHGRYYNS